MYWSWKKGTSVQSDTGSKFGTSPCSVGTGLKGVDVHVGHAHPSAAHCWWGGGGWWWSDLCSAPLTHNKADLCFLFCPLGGGSRSATSAGSTQGFSQMTSCVSPCPLLLQQQSRHIPGHRTVDLPLPHPVISIDPVQRLNWATFFGLMCH